MPKYLEIVNDIKGKIENQIYKVGQPLPKQELLAKEYATSRMTIQKALNILRAEGSIQTRQGQGSYINENSLGKSGIQQYPGLTNLFQHKRNIESVVISFEVRFPEEDEAERLAINEYDPIYDIIRLRKVDGQPYEIEYTLIPVNLIPGITNEVLHSSIYDHIVNTLGLQIGKANRIIRADKSDKFDQEYLLLKSDEPVLEVEQVVFLENGKPFEYSFNRIHFEKRALTYSTM